MNRPKVSVIIPVYNGEAFLEEAIKSVLDQNYGNIECIVVDDGSDDGSAAVARKYEGIVCLRQEHKNVASARNRGVREASGEYLAFLDADDIWEAGKLAAQIDYMEGNPDVDYCITRHSLFLAKGLNDFPPWIREQESREETAAYIPSALVVRKQVFETIGNFDESYQVSDDSDWFFRAKDAGLRLGIVNKNLLLKRVHPRCLMSRTSEIKKELMKSIRASLLRAKKKTDPA